VSLPLPAPGVEHTPNRAFVTPPLASGEVHVWRVDIGRSIAVATELSTLSQDERARANHFRRPEDRTRSIVSRTALRDLLARYVGAAPATLRFTAGPHGKPMLVPGSTDSPPGFNVAHSGRVILLAFSACDVGIDVEQLRNDVEMEELARRFFAPEEVAAVHATPGARRVETFFRIWTRKEAFLKAQGAGLSAPLDTFSTTTRAGEPRAEVDGEIEGARWYLRDLDPATGYAGAVVTSRPAQVVTRDWPERRA
jgi:4'-phosphopantetheinyl transferase